MGVMMAPVASSASTPACMALVPNFIWLIISTHFHLKNTHFASELQEKQEILAPRKVVRLFKQVDAHPNRFVITHFITGLIIGQPGRSNFFFSKI
mmetsp:Transcript_14091/g.19196  ORF Transcript_14091/g.19196 Transcript_14091/m.19196 type:complete len:95 (-) Transcript_14091:61-345(-)